MIGLYCRDIPPTPGGVSDHTLALARAIHARGAKVAVLARRGDAKLFAPIPCVVGLAPGDVAEHAAALGVTTVLIQYVPFLYARRGVSPALVVGAEKIARAGLRLAVFIHEPFVPFTRPIWWLTGLPQRFQLRALLRRAARAYTAVPRFAELVRPWSAGVPVDVAPVGATLPVSKLSREAARRRLGLADDQVAVSIFSPAASGFAHDWVAAAARRLRDDPAVRWVRFGFGSDRDLPGYPTGTGTISAGSGSPEDITATMRAMDIAIAPFVDGLTLRRSGAMLALAHGVPLLSSRGHLFDPTMERLAECASDAETFATRLEALVRDPAERSRLAARTAKYEALASTDALAERLIRDLGRAA